MMMLTRSGNGRRLPVIAEDRVVEADGVALDVSRRCARVDGYLVRLPGREAALLDVLINHAGKVVHRFALADAAGGRDHTDRRDLDRLMLRLNRRIQPSPLSPERIHRVGENGYLFESTTRTGKSKIDASTTHI
jgi:DNA-binding response OmpR family regulator